MLSNPKGRVIVVLGGQWGSESKGNAVAKLAEENPCAHHVRTGAINAGHTVAYRGKFYAMQSVPVGWVDPKAKLVIGRGAYIDPELLLREVETVERATGESLRDRLSVDSKSGVQLPEHTMAEEAAGLHGRMGSTAHGCMESQIARLRRGHEYLSLRAWWEKYKVGSPPWTWDDETALTLNRAYDAGRTILLEGTQGAGLDFLQGDYPYVTSRSTGAAQWLVEAGLSPRLNCEVFMVCRTYPIRVAGNSGPMGHEISWVELARRLHECADKIDFDAHLPAQGALDAFQTAEIDVARDLKMPGLPEHLTPDQRLMLARQLSDFHVEVLRRLKPTVLAEVKKFFEITTVTKKVRRIAEIDWNFMQKQVVLNRPDGIILNFLNYKFPEVVGIRDLCALQTLAHWPNIRAYLDEWERKLNVFVTHVGVSRETTIKLS